MASGPCGTEFKDAFSCFHYSKEEVKGSECLEQFMGMQECLQRYPELYPQDDTPSETSQDSASTELSSPNKTPDSEQDSDAPPPNTESSEES